MDEVRKGGGGGLRRGCTGSRAEIGTFGAAGISAVGVWSRTRATPGSMVARYLSRTSIDVTSLSLNYNHSGGISIVVSRFPIMVSRTNVRNFPYYGVDLDKDRVTY